MSENILENFKEAINLMFHYNVLPTPENYSIFYTFVAQEKEDFVKEMSEILNNNSINETLLKEIYNKYFFDKETKKLNNIIQKAHKKIINTEDNLESLKNTYQYYHEKIQNFSDEVKEKEILKQNDINNLINSMTNVLKQHKITVKLLQQSNEEIKKLREEIEFLKHESYIDPLTDIFNRRKLFMEFRNKVKNYEQNKEIYVIMMDIDNFKKINDTFNHRVGDGILKYVAKKVKETIKRSDVFGRYGGEEFTLILCNIPSDKIALTVLKNIKTLVSDNILRVSGTNEKIGRITLSYGMTKYIPNEDIEKAIERADRLMYKAKKLGKDRIVFVDMKGRECVLK